MASNDGDHSHIEMAFRTINCFANDGSISLAELEEILDIATKDRVVDEDEKRILSNIFSKLTDAELQGPLKIRVDEIKTKYNID